LAAGVTDSLAFTLAGFVADTAGGWKFVAQLLKSSAQNTAAKTLMFVLMVVFLSRRRWRFEPKLLVPHMAAGVCDVPANSERCASKNER